MVQNVFDGENGGSEKPQLMADINITPMVDVMLVLLVIFMVTAPLLVAGVKVDLPRNAAPKLNQLQKPIIVTLSADDSLYIGDEPIAPGAFGGRLASLRTQEAGATVYLRADRSSQYGRVLELLGRIGEAGFKRISLLSQTSEAGGKSAGAIEP
jgi:biopolymer transport protein ExbD